MGNYNVSYELSKKKDLYEELLVKGVLVMVVVIIFMVLVDLAIIIDIRHITKKYVLTGV